ncbi:MAG: class I adenylate-forming enzyme family protein [Panacagrimonas sp.]
MDIKRLMSRAALHFAEREAVVHGDRRLTFREAWNRGLRLANGLLALGLKPGDRVAVLEDNSIEASDIFAGAAAANLVRVPLYARNDRDSHAHMMRHTNCRVLLVSEKYAVDVAGIERELPEMMRVIVRDAGYEAWLAGQSDIESDVPVKPDDWFIIRHTGGTTGKAKAVAYSHKSWLAAGRDWFYIFPPVEPGDKCLHVGAISHASGYQYLPIWLAGGCNVMVDRFEVDSTTRLIEAERIKYTVLAPTMLQAILREPSARARDYSSLQCVLVGTAPIQDATALAAHELFGDVLFQGYGQTEALPIAFMGPRQWFAKIEGSTPLRACGMPLPFAMVEIWDEDNRPLPLGEIGEIVAKTDGQMTAFWNNEEATRERIVDGWIKTGDIGRIDSNGYLYLLDRADDMIISGGYNIWPTELENVIAHHPGVLEVAVFGVPHEKWGETPFAICVVAEGARVTEAEIVQMVADGLGSYKKPGGVQIRTEPLLRTAVGKIKRKAMREPYWAGRDRRIAGS